MAPPYSVVTPYHRRIALLAKRRQMLNNLLSGGCTAIANESSNPDVSPNIRRYKFSPTTRAIGAVNRPNYRRCNSMYFSSAFPTVAMARNARSGTGDRGVCPCRNQTCKKA
jgi:hypothetical protein